MVRIYQRRSGSMYAGARPRYPGGQPAYRMYRTAAQASRARLMNYYRRGQPAVGNRQVRRFINSNLRRQRAARIIQRAVRNSRRR